MSMSMSPSASMSMFINHVDLADATVATAVVRRLWG
jgi:hypothetical protein